MLRRVVEKCFNCVGLALLAARHEFRKGAGMSVTDWSTESFEHPHFLPFADCARDPESPPNVSAAWWSSGADCERPPGFTEVVRRHVSRRHGARRCRRE